MKRGTWALWFSVLLVFMKMDLPFFTFINLYLQLKVTSQSIRIASLSLQSPHQKQQTMWQWNLTANLPPKMLLNSSTWPESSMRPLRTLRQLPMRNRSRRAKRRNVTFLVNCSKRNPIGELIMRLRKKKKSRAQTKIKWTLVWRLLSRSRWENHPWLFTQWKLYFDKHYETSWTHMTQRSSCHGTRSYNLWSNLEKAHAHSHIILQFIVQSVNV